ncbi:serine/threonine-protein kinase atr-like isoform X2 [Cimex lectularius]|nr:serine/threonine-protein kinase atr-like isoform X2 [Cimex lectularius]
MQLSRGVVNEKAKQLTCKLFIKLNKPIIYEVWHNINYCFLEFSSVVLNQHELNKNTLCLMAEAVDHAILVGCSGVNAINKEMFSSLLNLIALVYKCENIEEQVKQEWTNRLLSLLQFTSVETTDINDISAMIHVAQKYEMFYPVLEECMLQNIEKFITQQNIHSDSLSIPAGISKSDTAFETICVNKINPMWEIILENLEDIIDESDSSTKRDDHFKFALNAIRTGYHLKCLLELKYKTVKIEFFSEDVLENIKKTPVIIKQALRVSPSVETFQVLIKLLSAVLKIVGEDICQLRDVYMLFLTAWHSPMLGLEVDEACVEGLCYLTLVLKENIYSNYTHIVVKFLCGIVREAAHPTLVEKSISALVIFFLSFEDNFLKNTIARSLHHLILSNINVLFHNVMGKYLLCILANRCVVQRHGFSHNLCCLDCDLQSKQTFTYNTKLVHYVHYASMEFCDRIFGIKEGFHTKMCSFICHYSKHTPVLKSPEIVEKIINAILEPELKDRIGLIQYLWTLIYNDDHSVNIDVVKVMYKSICNRAVQLDSLTADQREITISVILKFHLQIASLPVKELLIPTIKIILAYCVGMEFDEGTLKKLLNPVLKIHEIDMEKLLIEHEEQIGLFIAELIIYNLHRGKYCIWKTIYQFSRMFGLLPEKALFSYITRYILTHVMSCFEPDQVKYVYNEIAEYLGFTMQQLLTNYFEDIFCCIYFIENKYVEKKKNMLNLLLKLADNDLKTLIYFRYNKFICKVILNCQKPISIIRFLFKISDSDQHTKAKNNFLKQNIVGLLTAIDSKLTSSKSSKVVVKRCLKTIGAFIKILGSEAVTSIRIKLLNTLRTGVNLHINTFPKQCLKIWLYFCYSVDLYKAAPYLSTIFLQLLPLYSHFPTDIRNLFYYLVVENSQACAEYIPDLYFVPDVPDDVIMHTVWKAIKSVFSKDTDYQEHIRRTIQHMNYDNVEARAVGLRHLHLLLRNYAPMLYDTALKSETLDPIFEEIVSCVLSNVDYRNTEIKIACAMCLGELGALDPARFTFKFEKAKERNDIYDVRSKQFASLCIGVMVRELNKMDKIDDVNVIVSSIQELLKMYYKQGEKGIFTNFSVNEQDVLEPLLKTRYIFKPPQLKLRPCHDIVFGSHVGLSPTVWAFKWCSELLTFVPNSFAKEVFLKCLPCFGVDLEIVETVLPYIVLHVILFSTITNVFLVEKEMKCILHWDTDRERTQIPKKLSLVKEKKSDDVISMYSDEKHNKYQAIILDLIDFLYKAYIDIEVHDANLGVNKEVLKISHLKFLLKKFSATGLSLKSYVQNDFCHSLYHFEKSFEDSDYSSMNLFPLRNTYAKLNDLDGLLGVMRCGKKIPTIEERMLKHVVSGTVQDAVGGYEHLGMKYNSTHSYRVLIQCYLCINQPFIALRLSKTLINESFYMEPSLYNDHIEVLWSTSSYDQLNKELNQLGPGITNSWCWGIDLIGAFQHLRQLSIEKMTSKVNSMQCHLIDCLAKISNKNVFKYRQGYWYIVKLHILNEVTNFAHLLNTSCNDDFSVVNYSQYFSQLDSRFNLLPSHGLFIQDVLKVRQQCMMVALNLSKQHLVLNGELFLKELGKMWIRAVKIERKNGSLTNAYSNIGIAEMYSPPDLFIQKAKYYRANNETDSAVFILKQGIRQCLTDKNNLILSARAKMLIAKYDVENMNVDFNKGYQSIYEAVTLCNLEENFVYLAQYLYKQHLCERCPDKSSETREMQYKAALNFSKSLLFGCKFIYQSMPCLLTLWLDFSSRSTKTISILTDEHVAHKKNIVDMLDRFRLLMTNSIVCLPTYMFMTAFSQILSRINHPSVPCFSILKQIILNILKEYPQQAIWSFVATIKTTHEHQKRRVTEILSKLKNNKALAKFIQGFVEFVNYLIDLSNKRSSNYTPAMKLQALSPDLRKFLKERRLQIMVPSQHLRNIDIPNYKYCKSITGRMQHDPFPQSLIYFQDVKEIVNVLFSVQMPKKLTFIGSDGNTYPILCKHMDDLRLDSRIMEFNSIINLYLRRDSAAHDRGLLIRTYSVVPLSRECGLIEWLPDVTPFKRIVIQMYKQFKIEIMTSSEVKSLMTAPTAPIENKLKIFEQSLLAKHPPILHKWFFQAFPRPDAWYLARKSYVRTLAVMSIVGYIVGLGDRHGENILLDTTTGEVVHVDFNCLFNKGEQFLYPETVPFRLTHNMVKAMGPTGMEGVFLKSCEITNKVLRSNTDQLISVIKPFMYDIDMAPKSIGSEGIDFINEEAKQNIINVQKRLAGTVRTKAAANVPVKQSNPLSVEGQIRYLVNEATSHTNLCQMYCGWAPYL